MHKVPTFAGFLSMITGRPVKYVEDRITHIVNNDHCGSDRWYDAELAFDADGTFRALRIDCVDDYGAYLQFGTGTLEYYHLPSSMDVPTMTVDHQETPSPYTPHGSRAPARAVGC